MAIKLKASITEAGQLRQVNKMATNKTFQRSNPHNLPSFPADNKCPECSFDVPWGGWILVKGKLVCKFCQDK
jgi:hypothetical protein